MFHINLKTKRVYVKYEIQKGIYNENKIETHNEQPIQLSNNRSVTDLAFHP